MLCVNVDIHMYWKFWEDVKQVGWIGRDEVVDVSDEVEDVSDEVEDGTVCQWQGF